MHCDGRGGTPGSATGPQPVVEPAACCGLTPNAGLPEGIGRVVVTYPGDGAAASTRFAVYPAGEASEAIGGGYDDAGVELPPGTYDVTVGGKPVTGVEVRAGHDTRIRAGVLHVYASATTRYDFLDPESGDELTGGYGERSWGFPAGPVVVRVAGQTETVLIEDGKITEF